MNHKDFIAFGNLLARYMPQVATWLAQLAQDQEKSDPGQGTIRRVWAEILGDCTIDECREVLNRIARQEVTVSSWQDIPGIIRREAVASRPKPRSEYLTQYDRIPTNGGELAEAFKEIRQCNKDPDLVRETVARWVAQWSDESTDYAAKCQDCRDVGMVICWHIACLREHQAEKPVIPRTMAVKCSCNASAKWGDGKDQNSKPPRYRAYGFCKWIHGALHELDDWFEWRRSQGIEHHPNFNSDLAIVGGDFA